MSATAFVFKNYQQGSQREGGGNGAQLSGEQLRESSVSTFTPDRIEAARERLAPEATSWIDRSHGAVPHLQDLAKADNGFTLIELLIVIVVLGILAAVVIFALGGITGKSAVAACEADGATVSTAMSALNAQYPGALTSVGTGATAEENFMLSTSSGGPYISSWPNNGGHYAYALFSGVLGIEVPGPSNGSWIPTAAFGSSYTSSTSASGLGFPYTGPTSCANV